MTYVQFKHKFHLLHGGNKKKAKLSEGRYYLAGTSIGNYALFGGGYGSGGYKSTVDAIDEQMTITNPTALNGARYQLAAASNDVYALFGGGRRGSTISASVDAYDASLTKSTYPDLATGFGTDYKRYDLAAANVGKYVLFAGGYNGSNGSGMTNYVQAFNQSLTKSNRTSLPSNTAKLAGASNGDYAVFGGGVNYSDSEIASKSITRYSKLLTQSTSGQLSVARERLAATNVGDYVLFGGGRGDGTLYPTVDAFDRSFTQISATGLSKSRMSLTATSLGYKAFFGGGEVNSTGQDVVDCYDTSLTHTVEKSLSHARYGLASASIGYKSIFAGGYGKSPVYSDAIDVYEDTRPEITVSLEIYKTIGKTVYQNKRQTVSFRAKQGMTFADFGCSVANTVDIPNGDGTRVTLMAYSGKVAVKYTSSDGQIMIAYHPDYSTTNTITDGFTLNMTNYLTWIEKDTSVWTFQS